MATKATLAALAKLTGYARGRRSRAPARADFADDPGRFKQFSVTLDDLLFDYSKQRIDAGVLAALVELAKVGEVEAKRDAMFAGEKINTTEKRAVLHTALRNFSGKPVLVDGKDVMPEVIGVREKMLSFAADVREGRVRGALGQPMTDVINIGIGGSDLGPAMATRALAPFAPPQLRSHFVSNVDGADIGDTLRGLDPSRTLFIVSSKTFTTLETMTNAATARAWIAQGVGEAAVGDHFAAVSTQLDKVAQFGIQPTRVFGFWDWVGGRYSVWSSIGLPLAIAIGPEQLQRIPARRLRDRRAFPHRADREEHPDADGAAQRLEPQHPRPRHAWRDPLRPAARAASPPISSNCRWRATASTCSSTARPPIRRPARWSGANPAPTASTPSSSSSIRERRSFPWTCSSRRRRPRPTRITTISWSPIAFAQGQALMHGRTPEEAEALTRKQGASEADAKRLAPHKSFSGSRPTSTFLYRSLDPRTLGRLIALYEHKVFTEGAIWDINSFDQWGVELGKELATSLAPVVGDAAAAISELDASTAGLVTHLRALRGAPASG